MEAVKPADALARHWTDHLPRWAEPFARLSRLDRPIGWQLLFLPCLMGIALARTGESFGRTDLEYAALLLVGSIAMRGAGCTWNDIADRKIDAAVERTRMRPIPAGLVSVRSALIWMAVQCLAGAAVLFALPRIAQYVALASLPIVAVYPFAKRFTWWPQVFLGLCFSWGALVAMAAEQGVLTPQSGLLYAGCVAWVVAYDTIYALQDVEDDALVGVRSTARLFGGRWREITLVFYVLAVAFWVAAAWTAGAPPAVAAAVLAVGALLIWPTLEIVDPDTPRSALFGFKRNALIGLLVAAAFAIAPLWRMYAR